MNQRNENKENVVSPHQVEKHFGPICEWYVVDHFDTVQEAESRVNDMLRDGHHARHTIIDGMCVVARRNRESPL